MQLHESAREPHMLADHVKRLREAKSWSQAHLADAAALNIRTVQRIERGGPASAETILSLAAALDADLASFQLEARSARNGGVSKARLTLAWLAVAPALAFVAANLLRSVSGVSGPYDMAAAVGGRLMSLAAFNIVSPIIFLGGAAAALALCAPALLRLRTTRAGQGVVSIHALELRLDGPALALAAAAVVSGGVLTAYAAAEFIRTP
jgi:transcriptional regulator with XRE-family HTH domain